MKQITISFIGYGTFRITTTVRKKEYSAVTHNTRAIDRYQDDGPQTRGLLYNTQVQAAKALYSEIKTRNSL